MTALTASVPEATRSRIFACERPFNWDDEDAPAITRRNCEAAFDFLEKILEVDPSLEMPRISPSVFGTVTLYWRRQDVHIFIRVSAENDEIFYQYEEPGICRASGYESPEKVQHRILSIFNYGMRYQSV